jgi:hypothetical protein
VAQLTCAGVSLYRCQAQTKKARKFLEDKKSSHTGIEVLASVIVAPGASI